MLKLLPLPDIAVKHDMMRVITVATAPEAETLPLGKLERSLGESATRYTQRSALFDELMSIPDGGGPTSGA
jgi:hypothetical protein